METKNWKDNNIINKLIMVLHGGIIVLGIAVLAMLLIETLLRFFGITWLGYDELLTIIIFWLYMFGVAYASYDGRHKKKETFTSWIKSGIAMDIIRLVRVVFIVAVNIVMCWWAVKLCVFSVEQESITALYSLPMIIGYGSIVIGLIISLVFYVLELIDYAKYFVKTYIRKEVAA